jgi:hypothetical protein
VNWRHRGVLVSRPAPHGAEPEGRRRAQGYILQYAPDGANTRLPDGKVVPQADPVRQFKILDKGR